MGYEEKIKELGFELPEAPKPLASYVPTVRTGNLIFTAGQVPIIDGELKYSGKICDLGTIEDGVRAAQISVLNCLSVIKAEIGTLDKIKRIVKITVFVNSAEGFTDQPKVANGASDLLVQIFGDAGKHARSAVGVNELPINASVEIEMIAEVEE